jgi:hypothetical protein
VAVDAGKTKLLTCVRNVRNVIERVEKSTKETVMNLYARHGDLVIEKLDTKPTGELKRGTNIVFAGDSSGHPHTLVGEVMFRRDGRRTFVQVPGGKPLELRHGKSDGHKTISLPPGDYEVRPLRERGDGSDRAVED